jgi:2-hydroxychromene-2-carboxylate isomerase
MGQHRVEFLFDYASPYSYLGSLLIEGVCARTGAELDWQPIVLGGVFQANDHKAPLDKPVRRTYLFEDMRNLAEFHHAPYRPRTEFFFKPILPLRATLGVTQGAARAKAVHALFHGAWALDLDLGDPAVVERLLGDAGLDGKALVQGANRQEIKDELKAITDKAIARGVFGAPTMLVDGSKMFWGHDRLPVLEHFLNKN